MLYHGPVDRLCRKFNYVEDDVCITVKFSCKNCTKNCKNQFYGPDFCNFYKPTNYFLNQINCLSKAILKHLSRTSLGKQLI